MLSGFYTAYAGLEAQYNALNILANNLANIDTNGYKEDRLFYTVFASQVFSGGGPLEAAVNTSIVLGGQAVNFAQGELVETGNPLDLALLGPGFFVVAAPWGLRYSRDGAFSLNAARQLVNSSGYAAIDENGNPIVLPPGRIEVNSSGEISVNGMRVAKLKIVDFRERQGLVKEGASLFRQSDPNAREEKAVGFEVKPGFIEKANVNALRITADLISALRHFQFMERSIDLLMNQMGGESISQLGRF